MLGVNVVWDTDAGAREFVARHKLPYPVGRDSSAAAGTPYGVEATPTTLFIDRSGILVTRKTGELDAAEFEQRIERLLSK